MGERGVGGYVYEWNMGVNVLGEWSWCERNMWERNVCDECFCWALCRSDLRAGAFDGTLRWSRHAHRMRVHHGRPNALCRRLSGRIEEGAAPAADAADEELPCHLV